MLRRNRCTSEGLSNDNKASALARHPAVVAKMQASREVVTKKVQEVMQYGITEAMDEAMQAFSMAIEVRAPAAMVAAAQLRAKLQGLLVDKKEIAVTQMASMTPTDKQLLLDAANQALAERKALLAPDQPITDIEPKLSSN